MQRTEFLSGLCVFFPLFHSLVFGGSVANIKGRCSNCPNPYNMWAGSVHAGLVSKAYGSVITKSPES